MDLRVESLTTMTNPPPNPWAPQPDQRHAPQQPYPGQPYAGQPYPPGLPYGYPYPSALPQDPTDAVGARVGQYLVDALLVAVPVIVLLVGFVSLIAKADPGSGILPLVVTLVLFLVGAAAGWLVFVWWPSMHGGQTPAMGWLNLRIVTEHGGYPSLGALTVRWLLLVVDTQAFGLVGLIVMLTTARHQRIGDMAANTLVVRAD